MEPKEAMKLIRELDYAATKAADTGMGAKRLEKAYAALFKALVGRKPTPEELKEMTWW